MSFFVPMSFYEMSSALFRLWWGSLLNLGVKFYFLKFSAQYQSHNIIINLISWRGRKKNYKWIFIRSLTQPSLPLSLTHSPIYTLSLSSSLFLSHAFSRKGNVVIQHGWYIREKFSQDSYTYVHHSFSYRNCSALSPKRIYGSWTHRLNLKDLGIYNWITRTQDKRSWKEIEQAKAFKKWSCRALWRRREHIDRLTW
jgi:hypothetical protein